ncbi:MAG: Multidrug resistance protein Stp [Chlamydiae bacterium]|nr:Multidrug resistance protein Stp [Chlamydiota bacterium]
MFLKLTEKNRKWWILLAMTSAISMIFIDITVLPVALPTIQRSLGLSGLGMQWIINSYILVLTIFLLAGGRLADRVGHRKTFCWGLILFAFSSALCGLSYHEWWFIASRSLQGIGGAILIPSSSAITFNSFPPHQRGKAMGLYVSIGSIFLALGPFLGGLFTQYFTWRLVFWINLPIALGGLILALLVVPKSKGKHAHFDWIGFVTFSLGISAIVVSLMQAKNWGWTSYWTLGMLLFGIFLLFLLWKVDREVKEPYIDFSFFRNSTIAGASAGIFCTQFILMVTIFWAIYFQNVLGFTPTQAGTLSLISNLPIMIAAPLGGHLVDKKGPRIPIVIGFSLVVMALILFLQNIDMKNVWLILSAIIPFGFGIPFIFTPSFTTIMGEIPPERRGLTSGTVSTIRQLGGTLGLAIFGTLFLNVQEGEFAKDLKHNIDTEALSPMEFQGLLSKTPEAITALKKLPEQSQTFVEQTYLHSYIKGFWSINFLAIIMALVGLILTLLLIRQKTRPKIEM